MSSPLYPTGANIFSGRPDNFLPTVYITKAEMNQLRWAMERQAERDRVNVAAQALQMLGERPSDSTPPA